jgi:hypothetical protein
MKRKRIPMQEISGNHKKRIGDASMVVDWVEAAIWSIHLNVGETKIPKNTKTAAVCATRNK